ncbi:MAG TPA: bile acid:sodium symporter family protein [Thermodesulfobacteriota bacterium]|nr:bile acid:sodium symporter family protein [Thermodesulfobacteriota bacterium]
MKFLSFPNHIFTDYFTFWIIGFSVLTYLYPEPFAKLAYLITPTLGVIMFGMGMTLTGEDFRRVILRPQDVAVGFTAQYGIMPFMGFALAKIFGLEPLLAAGVVLVGSCPGGTASNVITYLAGGDVALSVTMTSVSTILSPVFTPLLTYFLAGQWIPVPTLNLFISTIEIILLPVALGLSIRSLFKEKVRTVLPFLPMVSSIAIIFIVGVIVAANAGAIREVGLRIGIVVILHNMIGLILGFYIARLLGMDARKARAVSIEVGMQNSGLGVALARAHFGTLAALPSAMFSVWHNISGSVLAWWWRKSESNRTHDP